MSTLVRTLVASLVFSISAPSVAQLLIPQVADDAAVSALQRGIDAGCRDAGKRHNDPPAEVDSFCSCVMTTLMATVPADIWKQATSQAILGHSDLANQILAPYYAQLSACKVAKPHSEKFTYGPRPDKSRDGNVRHGA